MTQFLFAWIGNTDLSCAGVEGFKDTAKAKPNDKGPILDALKAFPFDELHVLYAWEKHVVDDYVTWLRKASMVKIVRHPVVLRDPTAHRAIYNHVVEVCSNVLADRKPKDTVTFHLAPGTPSMHAVWLLISQTRFKANLISSAVQRGAHHVEVPFEISAELLPELRDARDTALATLAAGTAPEDPAFSDIIHTSVAMREVLTRAAAVAQRKIPVFIAGESGTGKELLARAIHNASKRSGDFIAVNCGAIPENLIESILFGHKKGAFTGADRDQKGVFETAAGGTVFLDELGELPRQAQVKMLRVLQDHEITRVGESKPTSIDVRIIAATNRNMLEEVASGRFREDLFYRLAVAVLKVPPLRERKGDLPRLTDHFLRKANAESGTQAGHKKLSPGAKNLIQQHTWPGNIRELENTLVRAVVWSPNETISTGDMHAALLEVPGNRQGNVLGRTLGDGFELQEVLDEVARHYLERALEQAGKNKTRAAELVGLASYQTFTNWLNQYGVKP